jgi:hypothetical protein
MNGIWRSSVRRASICHLFASAAIVALALPIHFASAASPLSALSIQLRDLRPGYVVADRHYRTASTLASDEPLVEHQLVAHGWLGGYDARYQRAKNSQIQIGQFADRFGSVAAAHWWYEASLLRVPAGYQAISMPAVGNESTGIENQAFIGIVFRRDTVVMDIYVSLQVPSAQASVLSLARLVDRRIALDATGALPASPATPRPASHRISHPGAHSLSVHTWIGHQIAQSVTHLTLYVKTIPGARCSATVTDLHPRRAVVFSGYPFIAGSNGITYWRWREYAKGASGTAAVTCTYGGKSRTLTKVFHAHP